MTEPYLKQCPFCGANATVEEYSAAPVNPDKVSFSVGCAEEGCYGYQSFAAFSRRGDAIKGWNTRAGAPVVAALEAAREQVVQLTQLPDRKAEALEALAQIDAALAVAKGERP